MNGNYGLVFSSTPGVGYVIESSADLESWAPFISTPAARGSNETQLAITGSAEHRFFRVTEADE